MSATFVYPLPFTAASGSPAPVLGSLENLANDQPGMAWRGALTGYLIIDLGANPVVYDHVALFGSNLRASDTVRVQGGSTATGTGGFDTGAVVAFTGIKDATTTTKTIIPLGVDRSHRYLRIQITATGHPDGYAQFTRLIVGKSISVEAISNGAQQGFEGQSTILTAPGYRSVDRRASFDSWKVSMSFNFDQWRSQWAPLMRNLSAGDSVLFIPDTTTPNTWQNDAIFGAFTTPTVVDLPAFNFASFDGKIVAYSR